MAQHKWHKEIKAWADGAEIQFRVIGQDNWYDFNDDDVFVSVFDNGAKEFRIKPQPKEPQYLYIYNSGSLDVPVLVPLLNRLNGWDAKTHLFIGKIKLEQDDENI